MDPRSPHFHHHHNPRYVTRSNPNSFPFPPNPNFYSSPFSTNHHHPDHNHHHPTNYTTVSPHIGPPPPPLQLQPELMPQLPYFVANPNHNLGRSLNYPIRNDGYHPRLPDYPRGLPEFKCEKEGNRIEFRDYPYGVCDRDWNSRVESREDVDVRLIRDFRVGYEGLRGFLEDEYFVSGGDQRLDGERLVLRDWRDRFVESGSNVDGVREFSKVVEIYRGRESQLEFQRNGSKRSRDNSQEFNRTPRKQRQKKSAFLRIQKPSYKRGEDEQVHHLGHFNDARSSSFGSKDQNVHLESGEVAVEGSERCLVELDVSFKSNSLVAKAIVAPPLSSVVSDTSLRPRPSKVREGSVTDKDGSTFAPCEPSDRAMKSVNSVSAPKSSGKSDEILKRTSMDVLASNNSGVCDDFLRTDSVDANVKPRISKFKKVSVPKKGSPKLPPSIPSDGPVKSENFVASPNSSGNSDNGQKQIAKDVEACVRDVVSDITSVLLGKEKYEVSNKVTSLSSTGSSSVFFEKDKVERYTEGSSLTGSVTFSCLHGSNKVGTSAKHSASDDHGKDLVSQETSLVKAVKKKKIVKKAVKKVVDSKLVSWNSQQENGCAEPTMGDSTVCCPPASSEPNNVAAMVSSIALDTHQPSPNDAAILENCKGEEVAGDTVINKVGSDNDSGCCVISNIEGKRNRSTSSLGFFSRDGARSDECLVNGNNVKDLISHCQGDSFKFLNEITNSGLGIVVCNQLCQNEENIPFENDNSRVCPQAMSLLEDNAGAGCLSSENTAICKVPLSSSSNTVEFDKCLATNKRGNTNIDVNISTTGLVSQRSQLCVSGGEGRPEDARFPAESGNIFYQSISEKSGTPSVAFAVYSSNHGMDRMLGSGDGFTDDTKGMNSSRIVGGGGPPTYSSMEEVSLLFRGAPVGESFSTVDASEGVKSDVECIEAPQLDLLSSDIKDSDIVSGNSSSHYVDTTLRLSFKNPNQAGSPVLVDGFAYVGQHPCKGGIDILPQYSSTDLSRVLLGGSVDDLPRGSLLRKQKRKYLTSDLELSSPSAFDNEGPISAGVPILGVDISSCCEVLTEKEEEVALCGMDLVCSLLPSTAEQITVPPESCSPAGFLNTMAFLRGDKSMDTALGVVHLCSTGEGLNNQEMPKLSMMELKNVQIGKVIPEQEGGFQEKASLDFESGEGGNLYMDVAEVNAFDSKNAHSQNSSQLQSPDFETLPSKAVKDNVFDGEIPDFAFGSTYQFPSRDNDDTATNSGDILMETPYDTILDVVSTRHLPNVSGVLVEKRFEDDTMLSEKHEVVQGSSSVQMNFNVDKVDNTVKFDLPLNGSAAPSSLLDSGDGSLMHGATRAEVHQGENQPSKKISSTYFGNSSLVLIASRKAASSAFLAKPRTWHRTDNSSTSTSLRSSTVRSYTPSQRQLPKNVTIKFPSNLYVRKGNSLVRKAYPSVTQSLVSHGCNHEKQPNSSNKDQKKENVASEHGYVARDMPNGMKAKGTDALVERPRMPHGIANSIDNCVSSVKADLIREVCTETTSVPAVVTSIMPTFSENILGFSDISMKQADPVDNLEYQGEQRGRNLMLSNVKSVTYVKRKSNQLVASSVLPADAHITTVSPSNDYYKRRKNQLVRTSLDGQVKPKASKGIQSANLGRKVVDNVSSISFRKRQLHKVFKKIYKPSKFSLVWTLRGSQSAKPVRSQHILPHLFPWKRETYWRNFFTNLSSNSTMIRKLMLFRTRDTVYTRSRHGFSLRKLRESSVGGSSLKWSKLFGTHLNKSGKEATLAVAADDTENRDQKVERIFRIGSLRYKMDSSRRTLQRMSDDDFPCSDSLQAGKEEKKPYVPRRLVIGRHEYVRIGNGNKLIRDPKMRTRLLASEKVRWSLHTVRSRLAKKRKYCIFYTRFGKCNKDTKKCPYIHDPSKIAVCTKFLNGLCSNPDCKLTHKVIPERMPDCSYFLQGLCNNKNCPYRHVHVNPNASICEGFLMGYCADGDECRKKHSYVCPIYEATGSCPQGSKCKLHHPKSRSKGKKTKQLQQGNAQTRYFGSMLMNVFNSRVAVSEKQSTLNQGDKFVGDLPDYISITMSDGESMERDNLINEKATQSDNDSLDFQFDYLDGLIKPFWMTNI